MPLASPSNVKEFELPPELTSKFGIVKAIVVYGYITFEHKSGKNIRCEYDNKSLPRFKRKLEKAITANEDGIKFDSDFDARTFVIKVIELLVQEAEKEYQKYESTRRQEQNEKQKILDEINKDKTTIDMSSDEWEKKRGEKYNILRDTVTQNLRSIWLPLEFNLSIKCIFNIDKVTLPFAGIVLGAPSTLKTASLVMLRKWPQTFYTDHFTSKSLVSHSTAVTNEELAEIDMLPRWKNKFVLLPELAPIFTGKDDDLTHLLGILTRVLDGQGYQSDSGAHGHRGYDDNITFMLAGASVEIPRKVYKALGYLGPKLYFLRLPPFERTQEERLAGLSEDFGHKEEKIQAALFDYLKWLEIRPDMQLDNEGGLPKLKWNHSKDERDTLIYIIKLADLLAPLRGVSQTWETKGTQGSDYGYTIPIVEDPTRASMQLYNLARGHAIFQGRNYVTKEEIPLIIKVVLSTGPVERVKILDMLIANEGYLTTGQITGALRMASQTAKRTMIELALLGLVDIYPALGTEDNEEHQGVEKKITLKPEFMEWLSTKEFKELRKGFVPTDNSEHLKDEEQRVDKV